MQTRTHAFEKLKQLSQQGQLDLKRLIETPEASSRAPKRGNRLEGKQLPFPIS
jgi:hypothetical protein